MDMLRHLDGGQGIDQRLSLSPDRRGTLCAECHDQGICAEPRTSRHRLPEYLPPATRIAASKSLHFQADANATAMRRQVGQTPPVAAVDPRRYAAARRTRRHRRSRSSDGDNLATANLDVLDPETGRQQRILATM